MSVEDTIRKAVLADKRTDGEIAAAAGMNRVMLNRFKMGARGLSIASLESLAKALGLKIAVTPVKSRR